MLQRVSAHANNDDVKRAHRTGNWAWVCSWGLRPLLHRQESLHEEFQGLNADNGIDQWRDKYTSNMCAQEACHPLSWWRNKL